MKKYYRVLKETPAWEKGAIIRKKGSEPTYEAISDVWDKVDFKKEENYSEFKEVVENSPKWFERVYKFDKLKGLPTKYKTKEETKELLSK